MFVSKHAENFYNFNIKVNKYLNAAFLKNIISFSFLFTWHNFTFLINKKYFFFDAISYFIFNLLLYLMV